MTKAGRIVVTDEFLALSARRVKEEGERAKAASDAKKATSTLIVSEPDSPPAEEVPWQCDYAVPHMYCDTKFILSRTWFDARALACILYQCSPTDVYLEVRCVRPQDPGFASALESAQSQRLRRAAVPLDRAAPRAHQRAARGTVPPRAAEQATGDQMGASGNLRVRPAKRQAAKSARVAKRRT